MKWIEPENGGISSGMVNIENLVLISRKVHNEIEPAIKFYYPVDGWIIWKYPDESSRDADYERIRRIALGIENLSKKKPSAGIESEVSL